MPRRGQAGWTGSGAVAGESASPATKKAHKTIAEGRAATQMPPFSDRLSDSQIETLVNYIYTPLQAIPQWGMQQIAASRIEHHKPGTLPDRPRFDADIENLFVVVESRRPSCDPAQRRQLQTDPSFPDPLRSPWRTQICAGRPLCLFRLQGRLESASSTSII